MNYRAWLAEFVGTFGFVFVGVASMIAITAPGGAGGLAPALAHGLALAVMVTATAAISGGHLNPAVTIAAWVTNKIKLMDAVGYIIAQVIGAVLAVMAFKVAFPMTYGPDTVSNVTPAFGPAASQTHVLAVEAIGCFFLTLTVFGTAIDKRAPKMGGWYIGMVLTALALSIGFISGGSYNPARYLGPAISLGQLENVGTYVFAPILGAIVAALLYQYVLSDKDQVSEPA